jgi:hypothetical protein
MITFLANISKRIEDRLALRAYFPGEIGIESPID